MTEGILVVSSGRIEGSELRRLVDLFFQDPAVRERVRELTWALIGEGEALP